MGLTRDNLSNPGYVRMLQKMDGSVRWVRKVGGTGGTDSQSCNNVLQQRATNLHCRLLASS